MFPSIFSLSIVGMLPSWNTGSILCVFTHNLIKKWMYLMTTISNISNILYWRIQWSHSNHHRKSAISESLFLSWMSQHSQPNHLILPRILCLPEDCSTLGQHHPYTCNLYMCSQLFTVYYAIYINCPTSNQLYTTQLDSRFYH